VEASALPHPVGLGRLSVAGPLLRLRSDDQLVALFRAGHDEAFGTIHDRYRVRLFAYSRQMLGGSRPDAEDVLQDVFLRAYDALRVDGRPVMLRAWLYRVAHNRCIDQLRRPTPAPEDVYDLNRGVEADPLAEAERREDLRRLIADVRALPEQQRSALLMREMEGLSYNELADALDVTVPAIKSLLVRARVGLVEAIEARDTDCAEIRHDLAGAFDRGVRASGRSRRHLRECAGCRDYRSALRGIEKQLNGLAPSTGPLTTLAKVLGLGGAGSGAAAGGGAMAAGGGGGAIAVTSGGGSAVVAGAATATATKVVAVMAAAAVVGGGAAVEQVEHHRAPAPKVVHVVPAARSAVPSTAALAATQRRVDLAGDRPTVAPLTTVAGATKAPRSIARLDAASAVSSTAAGDAAPAYEPTTGGLEAPEEPAGDAATAPAGTDVTGAGSAGATSPSSAGSTGASSGSSGTTGSTTGTSTPATPPSPTAPGTGGASAPASSASSSPSGQVSAGTSGPVAQGAAAPAP
jgi:RNA polymerase sigma factor (sigma-70 family)